MNYFISFILLLSFQYPLLLYDINVDATKIYYVSRVIDGDTIEIIKNNEKIKLRLIGVDTPETVHPFIDPEPYGKESSNYMKQLLQGEYVYLIEKGKGRYGRLLTYVFRAPDNLFVNLELVRMGYGEAYTKYKFDYEKLFLFYEQRAKELKKGIWKQ